MTAVRPTQTGLCKFQAVQIRVGLELAEVSQIFTGCLYLPQAWSFQARKKSFKSTISKIKCLGPEIAGWGGGLPREGAVVENFVPSLESLSSLGFAREEPVMLGGEKSAEYGHVCGCRVFFFRF